jgi:hypothetical protein
MLDAQGVMDLLLELVVRLDFVRHGNRSVKAQSVCVVGAARRDKLAALHWWGERTEPSARSLSVLARYFTLTSIAFDLAIGVVGRCTFSTPSWKSAVTFVLSASSGSVKLRRKLPKDRSMRWNFLF